MPKQTLCANKPNLKTQLSILIVLIISPLLCNAEVYKWADKNGNIHYSDIKPTETPSEKLNIKSSTTNNQSKERESPQSAAQKLDERKSKELEAQAEKLQAETQKRELRAQCESIKDKLKTLQEHNQIKINENGKVRRLSSEEIEEKKQAYKEQINTQCSK
tara:strand:- start:25996 stop:26478 length:483 start_codon:yes stop_codon:yes gene_type:complete